MAALSNIDERHSELDALREAIAIYIRSAIKHPAIHLMCQHEAVRGGELKPIPTETLFFAVQSTIAPVVQQPFYAKLTGRKALPASHIEHHIQQCIDLLFNGWYNR